MGCLLFAREAGLVGVAAEMRVVIFQISQLLLVQGSGLGRVSGAGSWFGVRDVGPWMVYLLVV